MSEAARRDIPGRGEDEATIPAPSAHGGTALLVLLAITFLVRCWFLCYQPTVERFYDERFSLRNVSALIRPETGLHVTAFYPSLSFVPQTAVLWLSDRVYRLTGAAPFAVFARGEEYTPTAYLLVRGLAALYGTASVLLLFLIGRRLYSPAVGLLAALLFSAMPRHIAMSAMFKPDIMVVALVLLGFWWSLDAAEDNDRRRFWLAGAGVGLAMSAKYTGIAAAPAVVVAALAGHWTSARRWRWLVEAGLASVLAFVVLNPHITVVLRFVPHLWRIGRSKGVDFGITSASVAAKELSFLVAEQTLPIFLLACCGAVGMVVEDLRRRRRVSVPVAMSLAVVVSFSLLWIALRFFRGHYYLSAAAFTSLWAAWALWRLGQAGLSRLPPRRRQAAGWALGAALVVAVMLFPLRWAYAQRYPSTWKVASKDVSARLRPRPQANWVISEGGRFPMRGAINLRARDISREPIGADVEVFPAARLTGARAAGYRRRLEAPGVRWWQVQPAAFVTHGPPLVVLERAWQSVGQLKGELSAGNPDLVLMLPEPARPADHGSLSLSVPRVAGQPLPATVDVAGVERPLMLVDVRPRRAILTTLRFALPAGSDRITVAPLARMEARLSFWQWRLAAEPQQDR